MPLSRLEYLFDRYVNYQCTDEEKEELMTILSTQENDAATRELVEKLVENTGPERQMPASSATAVLQNILHKQSPSERPAKKIIFGPWVRAAAIIFIMAMGVVFWGRHRELQNVAKSGPIAKQLNSVLPGGDKAILTLADGKTVALDKAKADTFRQADVKINNQPGLLSYHSAAPHAAAGVPASYNTLSTPRGGQYRMVLADGTRVWLNAASALNFPVAFTGDEREVRLTGEAYFEVAKDKARPFIVNVGDIKVTVLGTHFNVNAYPDDPAIKTSLLEGSVRITQNGKAAMLRPGQQAVSPKGGDVIKIADADMDEAVAWKNGLFQFDGADITSIMQQIGRWYDVDVVFEGKPPVNRFEGKISRSAQLSDVLQILELSKIKFSVQGKKIVVR